MIKAIKVLIIGAAALALLAACTTAKTESSEPTQPGAITSTPVHKPELPPIEYPEESEAVTIPVEPEYEDPWSGWSDDMSRLRIKPLDIDLEAETQWNIFRVCGYDNTADFALLMAIAYHETGFNTEATGDNGGSIGLFQINVKWHRDRMKRLGVTDLQDPAQCAAVALDYLKELESRYGFEPFTHEHFMAYNMGPSGARKALGAGTTETAYSREIMRLYREFLEELEGYKQ